MSKYDKLLVSKMDPEKFEQQMQKLREAYPDVEEEKLEEMIMSIGPKRMSKARLLETDGWREGYTKKTLDKKREERKIKKKHNKRKKK